MAKHPSWDDPRYEEAYALHARYGPIDMHLDSIIQQRLFRYNLRKKHKARFWGQPFIWHADFPRMTEARYGGALMGIHWWPTESERAWRAAHKQIDVLDRFAEADPGCLRVRRFEDFARAEREGKLALAPAVEGAHMLNGRIERVAELVERGVSYLTLTHFSKNVFATPSMGRGSNEDDGLTTRGRELIRALNAQGLAVDIAHVNTPGALEACELSELPVLCTHTGAKAVHDAPRCISDEVIDAVAATDGVIGVLHAPVFLAGKMRAPTECVIRHMLHILERVGPRHLGIGTDFDGWVVIPNDQKDCRDLVKVTQALLDAGVTEEEMGLILRKNTLRVLEANDARRATSAESG